MVSSVHVAGGAVIVLVLIGIGAVFWFYRRRKREQTLERMQQLSRDISSAMERRGARNPKLLQHKLDNAENAWERGEYSEAERIMEDVERLVQLS